MKNFDSIIPIDNGEKVLTLAGAGLGTLRNYVDEKLGRESHCVLGSTFLNPTTAAGVSVHEYISMYYAFRIQNNDTLDSILNFSIFL